MTAPLPCTLGAYCPLGTITPVPCPVGTFGNTTDLADASNCLVCPAGSYCNITGATASSGPCAAGFACPRNSSTPAPAGHECPAGSYCPQGTPAPVPCPAGTFLPTPQQAQLSDCLACAAGSYCNVSGLTAVSGSCSAGYVCASGESSPTPAARACSTGHYCLAGALTESSCPPGEYQDETGRSTCKKCPAGNYCPLASSVPLTCTPGNYCPANATVPIPCPAGTYSTTSGLSTASVCITCPAGSFCVNGSISGPCAVGYFCEGGASVPQPLEDATGGLCPVGHYCPSGTTLPVPCAAGTVTILRGAWAQSNCTACPAGYSCLGVQAFPCLPGYYCPAGQEPVSCQVGTYSSTTGAVDATTCLPCRAGFVCDQLAQANFSRVACPQASYCPAGSTAPSACPAGTYNPTTGGTSLASACITCPVAHYCPLGALSPIACPGGFSCAGGIAPLVCPAGFYCNSTKATPTTCPGGFYCPQQTEVPLACPVGFFCPLGSSFPVLCPLGTRYSVDAATPASSAVCVTCPAGTYGTHPTRLECRNCTAGYVCEGGTISATPTNRSSDKGYVCPVGHYCPEGSSEAQACWPGSYNQFTAGTGPAACLNCTANTFQSKSGATGCLSCGSSSTALPGQPTCTCNGTNRAFQPSDRSCICVPRYEYMDESFQALSLEDGTQDCQEMVFARCGTGEDRQFLGPCVSVDSNTTCAEQCGAAGGTFVRSLGARASAARCRSPTRSATCCAARRSCRCR
jgi:hypothetical protein